MRRFIVLLFAVFFLWMLFPQPVAAQEASPTPDAAAFATETEFPTLPPPVKEGIIFPLTDSEVQGVVNIAGLIPERGVLSVELSFSYAGASGASWFPLAVLPQPFVDNVIATWDTTLVTDGFYTLRLRMFLTDGVLERTVTNIRVRNYSTLETNTPPASATPTETSTPTFTPRATALPTATATPTFTPIPPPTEMPPNPASLSVNAIGINIAKGILAVIVAFVLFGMLLGLSQKLRS